MQWWEITSITRAERGHSVDTRSPGISGISQKDDTAQGRRRIGEEVVRLGSLQTGQIVKTVKIFWQPLKKFLELEA